MALFLTSGMVSSSVLPTMMRLLPLALLGSFAVGLPIALLTFWLAGKELMQSPSPVFFAANLAGIMLIMVTFLLGDLIGAVFYGLPSLMAANVFAFLGWFWILRPLREASHA